MKHKLTCLMVVAALLASTSVQSTAATRKPAAKAKSATVKKAPVKVAVAPPPLVDERAVSTDPKSVVADFDRWLDQLDESDKVAGLAVAVISGDKVLLERGLGFEDWATRQPITADSVFRLASLSKAFATTLTGILINDGMLSWET
ncbi:MAG: serine hydrolase, partial [Dokdonella sp.]